VALGVHTTDPSNFLKGKTLRLVGSFILPIVTPSKAANGK
jgi:hypothetical protein